MSNCGCVWSRAEFCQLIDAITRSGCSHDWGRSDNSNTHRHATANHTSNGSQTRCNTSTTQSCHCTKNAY